MKYAGLFLAVMVAFGGCVSAGRSRREAAETATVDGGLEAGPGTPSRTEPEGSIETPGRAGGAGAVPAPQLSGSEVEEYTESILNAIESLEECYRTGNFEKWQGLLTPLYRQKHGQPAYLRAHGWAASDLRGFFKLLIETRKQGNVGALAISRVAFVNPSKAIVFVVLEGREFPEPQHTFIRMGGNWLKGLPEEGG